MFWRRTFLTSLLLAVWGFLAGSLFALKVEDARWGFDGAVQPGRFTFLSAVVTNDGAQFVETELVLTQSLGIGSSVGAPLAVPLSLAPGASRLVIFYPYVESADAEYKFIWRNGEEDCPKLKYGDPAICELTDPSFPPARSNGWAMMDERRFPPTVCALDGLGAVILSFAPKWEQARRQALLDWVATGGTVHLIAGTDGKLPVFSEEWGPLAQPGDQVSAGRGRVTRHQRPPVELNRADIADTTPQLSTLVDNTQRTGNNNNNNYSYPVLSNANNFIFQKLGELTKSSVNWGVVDALAVLFLLLAGPGIMIWGRKRGSFVYPLLGLLSLITLFSFWFGYVGRRGFGEATKVETVMLARPLGGDHWDVQQWSNIFAVSGKQYDIRHQSDYRLYDIGENDNRVAAKIYSGREGAISADIPLFSRRPFVHRGKFAGADLTVKLSNWNSVQNNVRMDKFVLQAGQGSAVKALPDKIEAAFFFDGDALYKCRTGQLPELSIETKTHDHWLTDNVMPNDAGYTRPYMYESGEAPVNRNAVFGDLRWAMTTFAVGGTAALPRSLAPVKAPTMLLFLYVAAPPEWLIQGELAGKGAGYALLVLPVQTVP